LSASVQNLSGEYEKNKKGRSGNGGLGQEIKNQEEQSN